MNWLNTLFVLAAAFLSVYWEAAFSGVRHILGTQLDLLPALMVYASLSAGLTTVALLAFFGGLWNDALSANPLGISIVPLFFIGLVIYASRDLILRDQTFAQVVLGFAASAVVPLMTLIVLLTGGHKPLLGWGTLWQWTVVSVGGAAATPVWFAVFDWLNGAFAHGAPVQSSFRPDREIRRGR